MKRRYVWIVTVAAEDGKTARVLSHHETQSEARARQLFLDFGGYEGPVPVDLYPVGKVFPLVDEAA